MCCRCRELTGQIKGLLEGRFPAVWVSGEISNFSRPQSGHCYLTLKDDQAQIRAVMWRSAASRVRFDLHDGLEVICQGYLDVYAPRGSYQLVIQQIEPKGLGALELALRSCASDWRPKGLFDPARKRPLPRFPRRIAFVTSPTGAAVRDFLEVLRRRWRGVHVLIVPVRVQGDGARAEIAAGIELVNRLADPVDVLVVGRGGGSLEDLWAFNEEVVVRAIHASRIPVVSAVGHEIDVTLADLVADVRALTPSEAAERVVPAADELRRLTCSSNSSGWPAACVPGCNMRACGWNAAPRAGCFAARSSACNCWPGGSTNCKRVRNWRDRRTPTEGPETRLRAAGRQIGIAQPAEQCSRGVTV